MSWAKSLNDYGEYISQAQSLNMDADSQMQGYQNSVEANYTAFNEETSADNLNYEGIISNYKQQAESLMNEGVEQLVGGVPAVIAGIGLLKASYSKLATLIKPPAIEPVPEGVIPPEGLIVNQGVPEIQPLPEGVEVPEGGITVQQNVPEGEGSGIQGEQFSTPEQAPGSSTEMTSQAPATEPGEGRSSIAEADPIDEPLASTADATGEGVAAATGEGVAAATAETIATVGAESIVAVADVALAAIPVVGEIALVATALYSVGHAIYDFFTGHHDSPPPPPPPPPPIPQAALPTAQITPTMQLGL